VVEATRLTGTAAPFRHCKSRCQKHESRPVAAAYNIVRIRNLATAIEGAQELKHEE
jgi:hypothetical protein